MSPESMVESFLLDSPSLTSQEVKAKVAQHFNGSIPDDYESIGNKGSNIISNVRRKLRIIDPANPPACALYEYARELSGNDEELDAIAFPEPKARGRKSAMETVATSCGLTQERLQQLLLDLAAGKVKMIQAD